jgi:CO dehydrogenase nickel-insertion accessory protein CooC1
VGLAADMKHMVEQIQADVLPATEHLKSIKLIVWANNFFVEACIQDVWFVLNRVDSVEEEGFLNQRLGEKGIKSVGTIHQEPSISHSWMVGIPFRSDDALRETQKIVDQLENAMQIAPIRG